MPNALRLIAVNGSSGTAALPMAIQAFADDRVSRQVDPRRLRIRARAFRAATAGRPPSFPSPATGTCIRMQWAVLLAIELYLCAAGAGTAAERAVAPSSGSHSSRPVGAGGIERPIRPLFAVTGQLICQEGYTMSTSHGNAKGTPPWPTVEEQLAQAGATQGTALERLIRENQDFHLLRPEEANDRIGIPPWLRVHWRKAHPDGRYSSDDPTGGYPRTLRDTHSWMLAHPDLRADR